jgi:hypothetical protein
MLREDKNKNGKRNPETQIIEKKARKLNKKKAKLEKLQKDPEKTSQETSTELEPHQNSKTMQNGTSPRRSYMTVGGTPIIRIMLQNV